MKHFLSFFICLIFIQSCTEKETVYINGNEAPPDTTISSIIKEQYINRVYITLLGREAETAEFSTALQILNQGGFSVNSRKQLIASVQTNPLYHTRLYDIARQDFLNNIPINELEFQKVIYLTVLQNQSQQFLWPFVNYELPRLDSLLVVPQRLASNSITISEMHRRCANNYQYDQINMGSLNLVTSLFQNFLYRYPTEDELQRGIKMADGQPSTLFFESGNSKDDFIQIFFNSQNYYEGQVLYLFNRFLFRLPTSTEMATYTAFYKSTQNYKELQVKILSTNEFAGI